MSSYSSTSSIGKSPGRPRRGTHVSTKDKYCYYALQSSCTNCTCDPCMCAANRSKASLSVNPNSTTPNPGTDASTGSGCCVGCNCENVVVPVAVQYIGPEDNTAPDMRAKRVRQAITDALENPHSTRDVKCILGFEVSATGDRVRFDITPISDWEAFLGHLLQDSHCSDYDFTPAPASSADVKRRTKANLQPMIADSPLRNGSVNSAKANSQPVSNMVVQDTIREEQPVPKTITEKPTSMKDIPAIAVEGESAVSINEEEWTAMISIEGMTCASCVANIEELMTKDNAVNSISVNLLGEKATVAYNPRLTTAENIAEAIEDMGYDTSVLDVRGEVINQNAQASITTATLSVGGMTCASCVHNIETHLSKQEGIVAVSVNLLTASAKVTFDQDVLGIRAVLEMIDGMGYDVAVASGGTARMDEERARKERDLRVWQWRLAVGVLFTVPVFLIAMIFPKSIFGGVFQKEVYSELTVEMVVLFVLATPVQFWVGWVFYRGAYHALKRGSANMDVLVVLGTTAAYGYSVLACVLAIFGALPETMTFFDASAMIITFISLGKYLEHLTKGKTTMALTTLIDLQAKHAVLVEGFDAGDLTETEVPIEHVQRGDVLKVYPGAKVPTDGVVVSGVSSVDESLVTGESLPVNKDVEDSVVGGSMNTVGVLHVKATKVGSDTMLSRVTRMVEDAQTNKAPIEDLTDYVAGRFVPVVVIIALVTLVVWLVLGHLVLSPASMPHGFTTFLLAFNFFISVLVIACPCSLGLATPTAVMVGTGLGAKNGILIKGAKALETAHRIDAVLFDKTGTLTFGKPDVTVFTLYGDAQERQVLMALAAAQSNSEHPLGKALFQYCEKKIGGKNGDAIKFGACDEFSAEPGKGLKCTVTIPDSKGVGTRTLQVVAGNRRWMAENAIDASEAESDMVRLEEMGVTATLFGVLGDGDGQEGTLWCLTGIADSVRPESELVVRELVSRGIEPWMVTGDHRRTAHAIAQQLGIRKVFAEVLPGEKGEKVSELQAEGLTVAMVGDGVNDSVALAQADVGIAMGAGSDVAIETADVVLVKSDIRDVVTAIDISRKTYRRIIMNLIWAFAYNILAIPFAAGVLFPVGVMLPAWVCAGSMAASSVTVVCSSLLLNWYTPPTLIPSTDTRSTSTSNSTSIPTHKDQHESSERAPLLGSSHTGKYGSA